MTISSDKSRVGPYPGNGVVKSFYFDFKILQPADVKVVSTDAEGMDSHLVYGVDYSVTQNADQEGSPGGYVVIQRAPSKTTKITILRSVKAVQESAFTNGGGFYPKVIENALDKLTMLVQQLSEEVGRAYKTSVVSSASDTIAGYVAQAQEAATAAAECLEASNASASISAESAISALQNSIASANSALSAWAAASAAQAPTLAVVVPLLDTLLTAPALISFSGIYTPGGGDFGELSGSSPFSNENFADRRATLSNGSDSFDLGTVS